MSRTPGTYDMVLTRGTTWEETFVYKADGVPVDLTGYSARMQVRTEDGQYGVSAAETLLLELSTEGANPLMYWGDIAAGDLRIKANPASHTALNPDNLKVVRYVYGIELYKTDNGEEYVIPFLSGRLTVYGEILR